MTGTTESARVEIRAVVVEEMERAVAAEEGAVVVEEEEVMPNIWESSQHPPSPSRTRLFLPGTLVFSTLPRRSDRTCLAIVFDVYPFSLNIY